MNTPSRLTTAEMLAALDSVAALAWSLASRFHATNPIARLDDLHECAATAFKHAVLVYDPTRGNKFTTVAYRFAYFALIEFVRVESARWMHVSSDHKPYYAPAPVKVEPGEDWWHPPATSVQPDASYEDQTFWESVTRTLHSRERAIVLGVFRDGKEQKELAREMGVSKARVGQLYQRAIEQLRGRADLRELAGEGCASAARAA